MEESPTVPHNNIIDKDCQRRSGQNCQAIFPYIPIFSGGNAVFLAQKNFSAKPFACFKEPIAWNYEGPFKPIEISFYLQYRLVRQVRVGFRGAYHAQML